MHQRRFPRPPKKKSPTLARWEKVSRQLKEYEGIFVFMGVVVAVVSFVVTSYSTTEQLRLLHEERATAFEMSNYNLRVASMQSNMQAILDFSMEANCFSTEIALYPELRNEQADQRRACVDRISAKAEFLHKEVLKSQALWGHTTRMKMLDFVTDARRIELCSSYADLDMKNGTFSTKNDGECEAKLQDQLKDLPSNALEVSQAFEEELTETYPIAPKMNR